VERDLRHAAAPAAEAPTVRLVRPRRRVLGPLVALALVAAAVVAVAVVLAARGGGSPPAPAHVAPVPHSVDTAQQARNLAGWLRRNSR
jgi:hypothetical protein